MTERFTLISELGRGGMGVVWKARDEETGQVVALKLLREVYAEDPDYVTRFERELELAKRIHSKNVVQVIGYGVRDGTPYLAFEYVDGPSLRERLVSHGPYDWPEGKALLAQIAQGLADAHAAGVIHRDLKPSNVLIGSDGVAKLADFGIAKGLDLTRVTGTSTLLGTPAYLAPEGPADARSDLYSLGVIAYEILTGVVPFEGRTYQEVILRHVREAPNLAKLPKEARQIVGRLLAKNPAKRPQSASELLSLLARQRGDPKPVAPAPERVAASADALADGQAAASSVTAATPVDVAQVEGASARLPAPPLAQPPARWRSRRQLALLGAIGLVVLVAIASSALLAAGSPFVTATATPTESQTTVQLRTPGHVALAGSQSSLGGAASASATTSARPSASFSRAPATAAPKFTLQPIEQPTLQATPEPTSQPTPTATETGVYITGVVTASEGGPLAGIVVIADNCHSTPCSPQTAISRSDGSYAVGPLTPDSYRMDWQDPSGHRAAVQLTALGASAFPNDNYRVDVGASTVSGINAAMPLGWRITGTLTPAPGKSLPSGVWVTPFWDTGGWGWYYWECAMNADGTYATEALPAGTYDVSFEDETTGQDVWWSSSGLTTDQAAATPIAISSSAVGGISGQLPW